jgi:K+-sensing histidine kinase KdpD
MSIMAGIAENLGGAVQLKKSALGGLCVKLTLPLR